MGIKSRRKAREAALRGLYEMELGHLPLETVLEESLPQAELPKELEDFAREVLTGVRQNLETIDKMLAEAIADWDFNRTAVVDRNVLRIATYELFYCPSIPPAVTIDEAIEIGRKYSTAESGKFINGVLGRILKQSPKAVWAPVEGAQEEAAPPEPVEEPEEVTLEADSDEAKRLAKVGGWRFKSGGQEN